ncbi:hypothetical protein B0H66DRAFT_214895 [Apodospora peruviana]|uniref:Uncharacterized protein n=1 Tax=Apodospora peruviana TaxID=516989 RepID=A0AAE0ID09_9PEZI|nr:hypothetical protein B0H66DRAFT_214895 [Apodospora peruviana]
MGFLTFILSLAIANVSGYCLYHSAQSIPKLQQYERKAEKAAEWSDVAAKRLWDTRYTVGAGFVMTAISLLSSLSNIFYGASSTAGFFGTLRGVAWAALLGGGELAASGYMKSFWADKRKIPLMDDYNDAVSDTVKVMGLSDALAVGWGLLAVLRLLRY